MSSTAADYAVQLKVEASYQSKVERLLLTCNPVRVNIRELPPARRPRAYAVLREHGG